MNESLRKPMPEDLCIRKYAPTRWHAVGLGVRSNASISRPINSAPRKSGLGSLFLLKEKPVKLFTYNQTVCVCFAFLPQHVSNGRTKSTGFHCPAMRKSCLSS